MSTSILILKLSRVYHGLNADSREFCEKTLCHPLNREFFRFLTFL